MAANTHNRNRYRYGSTHRTILARSMKGTRNNAAIAKVGRIKVPCDQFREATAFEYQPAFRVRGNRKYRFLGSRSKIHVSVGSATCLLTAPWHQDSHAQLQ